MPIVIKTLYVSPQILEKNKGKLNEFVYTKGSFGRVYQKNNNICINFLYCQCEEAKNFINGVQFFF